MDYCSTTAGASLVAHHYPESSKIVAWAIPSGWSGTRKLGPNQRRPGIAPTLAARPREDSGFADHQALASGFHCRPRHFSKRVDFENPLDLV